MSETVLVWRTDTPQERSRIIFQVICDMLRCDMFGYYLGEYEDGTFWMQDEEHKHLFGQSADMIVRWAYFLYNPTATKHIDRFLYGSDIVGVEK